MHLHFTILLAKKVFIEWKKISFLFYFNFFLQISLVCKKLCFLVNGFRLIEEKYKLKEEKSLVVVLYTTYQQYNKCMNWERTQTYPEKISNKFYIIINSSTHEDFFILRFNSNAISKMTQKTRVWIRLFIYNILFI